LISWLDESSLVDKLSKIKALGVVWYASYNTF
jgi:hypothetical protein